MTTNRVVTTFAAVLCVVGACNGGESTGPESSLKFTKLSAGLSFTCALDSEGTAYCWGLNDRGQLGDGTYTSRTKPVKVATDVKFTTITSSPDHTCALTPNGAAYCWGNVLMPKDGKLTATTFAAPLALEADLRFISIAASSRSTCATTSELDVYCWGRISSTNPFGDALFYTGPQPAKIATGMVAVVAGTDGGYCSVDHAALAYCWGLVFYYPQSGPVIPPIGQAVSTNLHFTTLRRGFEHYCGVLDNGAAECWGANAAGQVGIGNTTNSIASPTPINSSLSFTAVAAGGTLTTTAHSCGLAQDGSLYCWGANNLGQLGIGNLENRATPTPVSGKLTFTTVRAGALHTCAISTDSHTYCWGDGAALGNGTEQGSSVPKRVSGT